MDSGPTRALHQNIKRKQYEYTQDPYIVYTDGTEIEDLYIKFSLKFPVNMSELLGDNGWVVISEFKTSGDYRLALYVYQDYEKNLYWYAHGDNVVIDNAPYKEFWYRENKSVPVPLSCQGNTHIIPPMKRIALLLILFTLSFSVFAHPHIMLKTSLEIEYSKSGCDGIWVEWEFDRFFSISIINDFDLDKNGHFDNSEVNEIKQKAFSNLKKYGYFIYLRSGDYIGTGSIVGQGSEEFRYINKRRL